MGNKTKQNKTCLPTQRPAPLAEGLKKSQVSFSSGLGSTVVSLLYISSHLTHRNTESLMIIWLLWHSII